MLGDILQRGAVMCQSAHIRASMEATWHRIDTLERKLAGLFCLRRSEEAASAAHTAWRVIDRIYAKSSSLRIPSSWLSIADDLFLVPRHQHTYHHLHHLEGQRQHQGGRQVVASAGFKILFA
jgi:hypothetical protein